MKKRTSEDGKDAESSGSVRKEKKLTKAQQKAQAERRRDYRDQAGFAVSVASLGLGVAALCMNEKNDLEQGDEMSCKNCTKGCTGKGCTKNGKAKSDPVKSRNATDQRLAEAKAQRAEAKKEKKAAAAEKKAAQSRAKAAKDRQKAERSAQQEKIRAYAKEIGYSGPIITPNAKGDYEDINTRASGKSNTASSKKWVAMEMNKRTGGDRQAIVCSSKQEAEGRAKRMKRAHQKGSQRDKDCVQGYARIDVSEPIDIPGCFAGGCGMTRV